RFGVLGAGAAKEDPVEMYEDELWTSPRKDGPDRTMVESYVRVASEIQKFPNDSEFFKKYTTVNYLVREFPASAEETAGKILDLHVRHAASVCDVTEAAIKEHAQGMLRGTLAPSSLVRIVAGGIK